jgi:citronellol/citronellal dehydrogenase
MSTLFRPGCLEGDIVMVTGAGSGIGRTVAQEMSALGAHVVLAGRRSETLRETAALLEGPSLVVEMNIRDSQSVEDGVRHVLRTWGRIDVLVNNAGGQFYAPAESISPNGVRAVIDLNLQGTWHMCREVAVSSMIPRKAGCIINLTFSPHNGVPGMVHSAAARAGIENMTRTLATEWARYGITVNAVALGQIATEVVTEKYPKEVLSDAHAAIPAGRAGKAEEVSHAITFFAAVRSPFVTGSVLTVDGGRDNHRGQWPDPSLVAENGEVIAEQRSA